MSALVTAPVYPPTSARAVEVVAIFGDDVVGVRHLTDPRGGVVRSATRGLLIGGAILLITAAVAFGHAARVAARNAGAAEAWGATGKPSWAFRPERLPAGFDALVLGASTLGLAALAWGLARRRSERNPTHVRLGAGAGVDFAAAGLGPSFDLIAPAGDGFVVHPAPGMDGEIHAGGVQLPIGAAPVQVTDDTRLRLRLGASTFHIASVPAPPRAATGVLAAGNRALPYIAGSVVVHLGLLALLRTVPPGVETAVGGDDSVEAAMLAATTDSTEDPRLEETPAEHGQGGVSTAPNARMAMESGQMDSRTPSERPGKRQVKQDGPPQVARREALEQAKRAGILGSSVFEGDRFASIAGTSDMTSGFEELDVDGGFTGDGHGGPPGFGHGPRGVGPGGGGHGWNTVSVGDRYATIPSGPRVGDDYPLPGDGPGTRRHRPQAPVVKHVGTPECRGSVECDPSIIKRHIKRNASKIAYCYERQLIASPGLTGTVDTTFVVMPSGVVRDVRASGVHDEVSSCIAQVLGNIQFPKFQEPFQVKYPFHVRPAGS